MSGGPQVDWQRLMCLGLGALRLPPEQFWSMTPVEFHAALSGAGLIPAPGEGAMTRNLLDELMIQFPDKDGTHGVR